MWILLGGGVNTNQPVAERHRRHFILSCTAASIMAVISFFFFLLRVTRICSASRYSYRFQNDNFKVYNHIRHDVQNVPEGVL